MTLLRQPQQDNTKALHLRQAYNMQQCVIHRFAGSSPLSWQSISRHAQSSPSSTALVSDGQTINYLQFAAAIEQTTYALSSTSVKPGLRCAILIENLAECWTILFALHSLGAETGCVPSIQFLRYLDLTDIDILVSTEEDLARDSHTRAIPPHVTVEPIPRPQFDNSQTAWSGRPASYSPSAANLLYTSGTTGRHKILRAGTAKQLERDRVRVEQLNFSQKTTYHCLNFPLDRRRLQDAALGMAGRGLRGVRPASRLAAPLHDIQA